jgi:putative endonuclease
MKTPTVYILASKPRGTLYVGVTSNLVRRIWQHREGTVAGFTSLHRVKSLVWYEQHETMPSAIAREKALKRWLRPWKFELIQTMNPRWRDLWPDIIGRATAGTPAS